MEFKEGNYERVLICPTLKGVPQQSHGVWVELKFVTTADSVDMRLETKVQIPNNTPSDIWDGYAILGKEPDGKMVDVFRQGILIPPGVMLNLG